MKNSQRLFYLLLSFITLLHIEFIIIAEASINTISFGSFACDATSSSRCTSASLEIVNNSSSNSFDALSYSSYDNNGEKIDLGTTLKFDTKIISSKARVFFAKDNQIIYNKYELFEPSISCGVNPMNKCFGAKRVLCCLNGKRGTGVFCLKEEEPSSYSGGLRRAYQVYRMVGKKYIYKVTLKISQNGRSRDFTFSEDNTIVSTSNVQGSIFYQHQTEQQVIFSNLQTISDNYVLMRMMHLGTVSGYNQIQPSEVMMVEKLSNFLTNQYSYFTKATCSTEYGQTTQTHTDSENKDDQFYNSETLYGIKNVLNQKFEIPKVDTTNFGNTVGDESGVDYFEFDINTPSISLNLLINNIYDI